MADILDKIVANKRIEVELQRLQVGIDQMMVKIPDLPPCRGFKRSLESSSTGIIAEFKRCSPSKGWIFKDARVEDVVPAYSENGAAAISVLTDSLFFGGTFEDITTARKSTETPILRKDFVVDHYQIFQARAMGADAVLLIAAVLSPALTRRLAALAKELGMDVLLEIHSHSELDHINEFVDVVGVNNRNLGTFVTDVGVSFGLVDKIPDGLLKISESGISEPQTVRDLQQAGFRGFLMGENFMKTANPGMALGEFIKQVEDLR